MIEVRGLTKAYGEIEALRGVDLSVAVGEMCVVLGPSGAGKSTLLRCINRLTEPGAGEIVVGGRRAPRGRQELRELRRHIRWLERRVTDVDDEIGTCIAAHPTWRVQEELLRSVPGPSPE